MEKLLGLINNYLYLGILVALTFIPLYPKFPLLSVSGTYVAIRIEDLLVTILILVWILANLKNVKSLLRERLIRLVLLYFFAGFLAVVSALLITKNISTNLVVIHFIRRIEYMFLFIIALKSVKNVHQAKSLITTLLLATVGVIAYGLGQKFFSFPVVSTMNSEFSKGMLLRLSEWARINSTFAGHYDLAAFMVLVLNLGAAMLIVEAKIWKKVIIAIFLTGSFYLLLLTESRISFAAYLVSIVLVFIFLKKKLFIAPVLILSLLGMVFISDLSKRYQATLRMNLTYLSSRIDFLRGQVDKKQPTPTPVPIVSSGEKVSSPPQEVVSPLKEISPTPLPTKTIVSTYKPMESTELSVYRSTEIRLNVEWPRAIRAFTKNPILGTGFSSITLATDNDYFRALGETGLFGFLSFGLIFIEITRRVFLFLMKEKDKLSKAIVVGISAGAVSFFINASFIDVFEASKLAFVFWMLMGIMIAIINNKQSLDNE